MNNYSGKQNKDRLIKALMVSVNDLQHKFQREDDEEKQWLIQNSPTPVIAELMKDMTVKMLHVLSAISQLEPVNGITISKQFGFSKGNVSKITRRLADKQIINFEYIPDNKKEVLFRTTPLGREINRLHQALHEQIDIGVNHFLQRYNDEELQFLINALQETLHTSWIHTVTDEKSIALSKRNLYKKVEIDTYKTTVSEEMNEVIEMLKKLDSRNLKKAKAILSDVFFSVYED
ncbi:MULTISPECIES: MarR family transcriptional regulator [unclassified Bacillus (in: firmicutes)]|uniref:MarR family transcriptional regulator n=1 Tax=unclassified Bacillus (in: firmicutes) TaxID=185979 RepID=UPI00191372C8|nr:MarR family transcriptional regulator [Bacillus sp. TH12]MBK5503426.1 MarR family transcriptional regulator [Bacillus sp. TH12]MBK5515612.1 MarR family transcriptional regulator [Bacillus sp. TH11]QWI77997.1 MarR family transcriptional regulator [Bacillus mycoides]